MRVYMGRRGVLLEHEVTAAVRRHYADREEGDDGPSPRSLDMSDPKDREKFHGLALELARVKGVSYSEASRSLVARVELERGGPGKIFDSSTRANREALANEAKRRAKASNDAPDHVKRITFAEALDAVISDARAGKTIPGLKPEGAA